jgi:hypothetical protein
MINQTLSMSQVFINPSQNRKRTFYGPTPSAKRQKMAPRRRRVRHYGPGYQPTSASQPGPELKWFDHGQNLTSLDIAPDSDNPAYYQVQSLVQMAAGDDGSQRNGLKIQLKKLNLRMKLEVDPNSDASNANIVANAHLFRILVYVDCAPNGAAPTWGQLIETSPTNEGQLYAYNKTSSNGRFKVLIDKWITVHPSYVTHDGTNFHAYGNTAFFKKSIPLDISTHYSDTANNLSSIQRNNIGMFICSDASDTTYTDMKFSYRARVRFNDF